MTGWINRAIGIESLDGLSREKLAKLTPISLATGKVIFRPGDEVTGFVLVISGRVGVFLTGPSGREILLYSVTPGETCLQTTLGLLGEQDYSGEAVTETAVDIVVIPKPVFMDLIATSKDFRSFVFHAFASRLQSIMHVLERIAFINIEERLATILLERSDDSGLVHNTHQELATAIGSAREVVSRRLELFGKKGLITLERGSVQITNRPRLLRLIS